MERRLVEAAEHSLPSTEKPAPLFLVPVKPAPQAYQSDESPRSMEHATTYQSRPTAPITRPKNRQSDARDPAKSATRGVSPQSLDQGPAPLALAP